MHLPKAARRLDPRTSLAVLIMLNIIAFAANIIWLEVLAVVFCSVIYCWCKRYRAMLRWLGAYIIMFSAVLLLAHFDNPISASFGMMFVIIRRIFCPGMFAANMLVTTRVGEMAAALQRMHLPRGIIVAVSVALRFFPTIGKEFGAVSEAMRVRGRALAPFFIVHHPAMTIENLLIPVMSRLAIVADELSNAAIVRGIDSSVVRTSYYRLAFSSIDVVVLVMFGTFTVVSFVMRAGVSI